MSETHGHGEALAISEGNDTRTKVKITLSAFKYFVSLPFKLAIAPFLDAFGSSAWDIMLRRTHTPFHSEAEFTSKGANREYDRSYGTARAFSILWEISLH